MSIVRAAASLVFSFCLAGVSTAQEKSFEDLLNELKDKEETTQTSPTIFQALPNGGVKHANSGLDCPGTLLSFQYQDNTVYAEDGSDISCYYTEANNGAALTYYIFKGPPELSGDQMTLGAARAIQQQHTHLKIDENSSRQCQLLMGTAISASSNSGGSSGPQNTPLCLVFSGSNVSTLVTTWKDNGWAKKIRMTGKDTRIVNKTSAVFAETLRQRPKPQTPARPPQPELGRTQVEEFCSTSGSKPRPGYQADGKPASSTVMALKPGKYKYSSKGEVLLYEDKAYMLKHPAGMTMIGCSAEQLSEILANNNIPAESLVLEQSSAATPSAPPPAEPRNKGFGKADVDQFCERSTTPLRPGYQFNNKRASADILALAAGRYEYPNQGVVLLFPDKRYLVQLPTTRNGIFGTDGDDLATAGGILGGCSLEQLSEIFEMNSLDYDLLKLAKAFE